MIEIQRCIDLARLAESGYRTGTLGGAHSVEERELLADLCQWFADEFAALGGER